MALSIFRHYLFRCVFFNTPFDLRTCIYVLDECCRQGFTNAIYFQYISRRIQCPEAEIIL